MDEYVGHFTRMNGDSSVTGASLFGGCQSVPVSFEIDSWVKREVKVRS